jgi:hypothetical protein
MANRCRRARMGMNSIPPHTWREHWFEHDQLLHLADDQPPRGLRSERER